MAQVRDIHNSIDRYATAKKNLKTDPCNNKHNRNLFLAWLETKESQLKNERGRDPTSMTRWSKTLSKYIYMFKSLDRFVKKNWDTLTKEDLEDLREGMETGTITGKNNKKLARLTRLDFYNKMFKSDFFKTLGLIDVAKEVFVLKHEEQDEVRFFTKDDLVDMAKFARTDRNKLFLWFSFDVMTRIGTTLRIKVKDIEPRYKEQGKQLQYVIHIPKANTKSNATRAVIVMLPETILLMQAHLQGMKKEDYLFNFQYSNAIKIITHASKRAKVVVKPVDDTLETHDFRRSGTMYFLNRRFSHDWLKKRLGHKPSSTAIDKYINYASLDDEDPFEQQQEHSYQELVEKYDQSQETIKRFEANLASLQEEQKEDGEAFATLQKQMNKGMQALVEEMEALGSEVKHLKKSTKK